MKVNLLVKKENFDFSFVKGEIKEENGKIVFIDDNKNILDENTVVWYGRCEKNVIDHCLTILFNTICGFIPESYYYNEDGEKCYHGILKAFLDKNKEEASKAFAKTREDVKSTKKELPSLCKEESFSTL